MNFQISLTVYYQRVTAGGAWRLSEPIPPLSPIEILFILKKLF